MSSENIKTKKLGARLLEDITHIFLPLINCITAASILKSVMMLLVMTGVMEESEGLYRILYAASDGFFFFLPFYLAITAAKCWKADPYIAMFIPITMFYPDLLSLLENGQVNILGIQAPKAIYHSGVIPILLAVGLLVWVEKLCDKVIPDAVRGFLKPIVCCVIVMPVTFLLLGPVGTWIGNGISFLFMKLYEWNHVIAGVFMGTLIQPMVSVGAHWSIVPICINNIAEYGYDTILPLMAGAVYGQSGAALAMSFIYSDKEQKKIARQASFSAFIGVTEPALFGVNLPNIRPMVAACIAGAVGGGIVGAAGTRCAAFAFPSVITAVAYVGQGFITFLLVMLLGLILGFLGTMLQKKQILIRLNSTDPK